MPKLVGIVNITEDSFFDGGQYLDASSAIDRAHDLAAQGADVIEIGGASSHPDSRPVSATEESKRVEPVLSALLSEGITVSVDSSRPAIQRVAVEMGATYINDILGFPDPSLYPFLAQSQCKLIVMHAITAAGRVTRVRTDPVTIWDQIEAFFDKRIAELGASGISTDRLILDPGLGFFLGDTPEPSLTVLGSIRRLSDRYQLPVMISASRKSFLQTLVGKDAAGTGSATLAAELYAALSGVDFIRTHDVGAFREASSVINALIDTARRSVKELNARVSNLDPAV